jgi:kynureninase
VNRKDAEGLDRADDLAPFRARFELAERPIYMDGNSLGPPSSAVAAALTRAAREWQDDLVEGWETWIDRPGTVGDRLGRLLGAADGQVLVCDSTTVNLYKLAWAAIAHQAGRRVIVAEAGDFPTDRYVLQGLAETHGLQLRLVETRGDDPEGALEKAMDSDTALVCLSHVHFRTGRKLAADRLTAAAHDRGALILWDLAHSAGSVPVDLDGWEADLAVGCTYKHLNAGPGSPGFLYVRRSLQDDLRQPIWGWFGQDNQFEMETAYRPRPGIGSFLAGTPGILSLAAVDAAVALVQSAGPIRLYAKAERMTRLLFESARERLVPLGADIITPKDPTRRGAHVSVSHPRAWPWCRALIDRRLVVADFRTPDVIRLGPGSLYSRFVDCYDAVEAMAQVMEDGFPDAAVRRRVT